jgi:hypothetical protein
MQNPGAAMVKKQTSYMAYLLRLWRVKEEGKTTWRASLQSPQTRERRGFASLDVLFDFLRQQTETELDSEESERPDHDDRQD